MTVPTFGRVLALLAMSLAIATSGWTPLPAQEAVADSPDQIESSDSPQSRAVAQKRQFQSGLQYFKEALELESSMADEAAFADEGPMGTARMAPGFATRRPQPTQLDRN